MGVFAPVFGPFPRRVERSTRRRGRRDFYAAFDESTGLAAHDRGRGKQGARRPVARCRSIDAAAADAIDIRDTRQPPNAALTEVSTKEYETNLYSDDGVNGNAQADRIIDDNLSPKGNVVEPACPLGE
jgi:hypothetical protein